MSRDIYHIASDYLSGRINDQDRQYFLWWMEESPENREIFAELERVWKITGTLSQAPEPDVDAEWKRFTAMRETGGKNIQLTAKPTHSFYYYATRIAAVVIPALLILSVAIFLSKKNQTLQHTFLTINSANKELIHQLPDGTEVCLNKNTSLTYPKKFGKERTVKLSGEAFFKVSKLGKPFIVDAGRTSVKVLGTHFNVKNYPSSTTLVFVEEGSVLFSDVRNYKNATTLKAGEMGLFRGEANTIEKVKTANGNAWLTKKLHFENSTLEQVKTDISNYFGQNVVLPHELSRCLFTGEFTNPNITNVLDVISFSVGCQYSISNDTVYFKGEGCN